MSKNPGDAGYQAFRILQVAFVIIPIIAGLDKFFYFLTEWSQYLSPNAASYLRGYVRTFMVAVGIVEIIVGIGVIFKSKVFAYIISAWLLCIIINLFLLGKFWDIALRDFGLLLSSFALGRLAQKYET